MVHSFDVYIAKKYGMGAAVILHHIAFWVQKNESNGTNYHDGEYWTYNSYKAFSDIFPYLSEKQIKAAIKKLKDAELIKIGDYNDDRFVRPLWYTLTETGKLLVDYTNDKMTGTKGTYGQVQKGLTDKHKEDSSYNSNIYNNNIYTDINITDIKEKKEKKENCETKKTNFDVIIEDYTTNAELRTAIYEFIKMRKAIKSPMTDRALKQILNKLDTLASSDSEKVKVLDQSIMNSWRGVFQLREDKQKKAKEQERQLSEAEEKLLHLFD